VVIAGFLLGSTHDDVSIPGVIPNEWIAWLVGGNSFSANFFVAVSPCSFMVLKIEEFKMYASIESKAIFFA
jgi:hypothetical protein